MAKSKEDVKYGAAQAKLSDDEMLRTGYAGGTPLEAGKIADAKPVDLFAGAQRVSEANASSEHQEQRRPERKDAEAAPAGGRRDGDL